MNGKSDVRALEDAAGMARDAENARWQAGLYGWFARHADSKSDAVTLDRAGWLELVRSLRTDAGAAPTDLAATSRRVLLLSETCFRLFGVLRLYNAAGVRAQADPDAPDELRRLLGEAAVDVEAELAAAEAVLEKAIEEGGP